MIKRESTINNGKKVTALKLESGGRVLYVDDFGAFGACHQSQFTCLYVPW